MRREEKMDTTKIYQSGILSKGEDIIECIEGTFDQTSGNIILLTNMRLMHLIKPGIFSKGLDLLTSIRLGNIASVSISGLIKKKINIRVSQNNVTKKHTIYCRNGEDFANRLIAGKNNYIEERVVEAKTIIVQEGKKENAIQVLQKRLARGEITLEEFHQIVQRL